MSSVNVSALLREHGVALDGGEDLRAEHFVQCWEGRQVELDPPVLPVLVLFQGDSTSADWVLVEYGKYRGDAGGDELLRFHADRVTLEFAATWLTREGLVQQIGPQAKDSLGQVRLPSTYRRENPRLLLTALQAYVESLQEFLEARSIGARSGISAELLTGRAGELLASVLLYPAGLPGVTPMQAIKFRSLRFTDALSGRERLIRKAFTKLTGYLWFTAGRCYALDSWLAGHLRTAVGKLRVAIDGDGRSVPGAAVASRATPRREGKPAERARAIEQAAILLFGSNPEMTQKELADKTGVSVRQLRNYPKLKALFGRASTRSASIRKGIRDARTGEVDASTDAEVEDG